MTTDFERFGYSKARPSRTTVSPAKDEVERVAAAIYSVPRTDADDKPHPWNSATDAWRSYSIRQAEAAIAAMSPVDRLREALDLTRRVRAMVRAENSRVFEARRRGVDVMDVGSRDEADGIQADLYAAWPAKRLDALIAALSSPEPMGEGE